MTKSFIDQNMNCSSIIEANITMNISRYSSNMSEGHGVKSAYVAGLSRQETSVKI
jgi:hypothetical protein